VASPLNGLALLYVEQGKYAEAESIYQRALHIRERQLGPEHPDTAETLHDFAAFQEIQGDHQEALTLYQRTFAIRQQALGAEHPKTRTTHQRLTTLRQAVSSEAVVLPHDDTSPKQSEPSS
jgi:tetratricopeptide (TPR) repeat protein